MSHASRLLTLAAALAAAACTGNVRTPPPARAVIEKPVPYYVPIAPELRRRCTWSKDAPVSLIFEVSRGRRKCLEQYEAQLDGVDAVQGKPAPGHAP